MAQEIDEIYQGYWQELQNQPTLNSLNPQIDDQQTLLSDLGTPSKVAEHRLWIWLFSVFSWMQQVIFDRHQEEVEEIVAQNAYGHLSWWVQKMKEFQYGDSLFFDAYNRPGYQTIEPSHRVVSRAAAISQGGGNVLLKAAKENIPGQPEPLSGGELQGLQGYCNMIQPAGPTVNVISLMPDVLRISADIYLDPLLYDGTGQSIANGGVYPVEEAIADYIANIEFNGEVGVKEVFDAISAVPGVNDIHNLLLEFKTGSQPYAVVSREYSTVAGYAKISTASGEQLGDTLNYILGD